MPGDVLVRFVILARDASSARQQGFFQAVGNLRDHDRLTAEERATVDATFAWFDKHLPTPVRLSRSRRSGARKIALSWFRTTAVEHIRRMRELAPILRAHGFHTRMITTRVPGTVVYEDAHQVVGIPHRDSHII